ncbi:hypothetical protein Lalb_Chr18g0044691 [Lupinus albus]|uniref:Uncharacterized protein n=1 Tax=Lupinus albus TaxID=3870 RepID=A0A6A4NWU4_LUPAL|nr:hypothetical protein Lalb_Chr18g0044691 [Lupinus albus]
MILKGKTCNKGVLHPLDHEGVRIKVRMSKGQFNDLIEKVDMSKGNLELGCLIIQECLKGRLHANVVVVSNVGV